MYVFSARLLDCHKAGFYSNRPWQKLAIYLFAFVVRKVEQYVPRPTRPAWFR